MLVQKYKDMLSGKSVIRQLSEFATARGQEIGYENVFDYSLGNCMATVPASVLQVSGRQLRRTWRKSLGCLIVRSTFSWHPGRQERWHMLFVW